MQRAEPVTLTTTDFGVDDVTVGRPILMCERARKVTSFSFTTVAPVDTPTPAPVATPIQPSG